MKKNSLWSQGGSRTGPGKEVGKEESLQQPLQHPGILHCPMLLAQGAGARSQECCKPAQPGKTRLGPSGHEGSAGVKEFFGRLGGCRESLTEPMYQSWPLFETLPSPAVMHWLVTKKHTVQDKGFWQPHMDIKYCTIWGFIMWPR